MNRTQIENELSSNMTYPDYKVILYKDGDENDFKLPAAGWYVTGGRINKSVDGVTYSTQQEAEQALSVLDASTNDRADAAVRKTARVLSALAGKVIRVRQLDYDGSEHNLAKYTEVRVPRKITCSAVEDGDEYGFLFISIEVEPLFLSPVVKRFVTRPFYSSVLFMSAHPFELTTFYKLP